MTSSLLLPRALSAACAAGLCGAAMAQSDLLSIQANLALGLESSEIVELRVPIQYGVPMVVDLPIEGVPFSMDLAPHSVRAPGFQVVEVGENGTTLLDPGPVPTFRGTLLEDPGSVVAAGMLDHGLYARIRMSSGDEYWLEPLAHKLPSAGMYDYALYHNDDILPSRGTCGGALPVFGEPVATQPPGPPSYGPVTYVCELACDSDVQYFNDWGSSNNVMNRIQAVINAMNVQYETEVDITHDVVHIIVRTTTGPYTSSDPGTLLSQFRNHWIANQGGVHRDLAHLFTGKNLTGSVIGIAYLGVVCSTSNGYGLVESDCCGSFGCTTDLSAHEIGHNWNANHCACSGFTMNSGLTCSNKFHNTETEPDIIAHRNSRNCLDTSTDGTVLYYDGFESGNFVSGGWTISDPTRVVAKKKASKVGTWGARLKKGGVGTGACTIGTEITRLTSPTISTVGFSNIEVYLWARFRQQEIGCEYMDVEWYNGATWSSVLQVDKHAWDEYVIALPAGANNNASFRVRLTTNAKGPAERAELDDFYVVGN